MPLGTIERKPPAFFKHGMSSLSKLVVFSILSVVLMVADVRYGGTQPLRATISLLLYPMEWLSMRPQWLFDVAGRFFEGRDDAQAQVQAMTLKLQGLMPSLPSQNSSLRATLMGSKDYMDGLMEVSDALGNWIEKAQQQGQINPALPAVAVLYTLFARACDPVLEFLKMGEQHTDEQILDMVMSTCFNGLSAR